MALVSGDSNGHQAHIAFHLSFFELPPFHDLLFVGRKAAIGTESVKRMVDALAPGQYEVVPLDTPVFESVAVRKQLLELVPREALMQAALDVLQTVTSPDCLIKARVRVEREVMKVVPLT